MIRLHEKGADHKPRACQCGDHGFVRTTKWGTALFDVLDGWLVAEGNWYKNAGGYAVCKNGAREIAMQHMFFAQRVGRVVDHVNGDRMDNRRANLRWATFCENIQNSKAHRSANKSCRYKGVSVCRGGWAVECKTKGTRKREIVRSSAEDAARLYDQFAAEMFGPFARTNKMLGLLP